MPEGDSLHRAAERLRVLEGERLAVEARHPRAIALRVAERLDGRRLDRVEAVGKNLLLSFEGRLVLRSHLRMRGRWRVQPAGSRIVGRPWLVLRGREHEAVLFNGPVLDVLDGRAGQAPPLRLGPDIMGDPPDIEAMVERLRTSDRTRQIGEALLDQRLVAGIGNMWKAEGLFLAGVSPWTRVGDLAADELKRVLSETSRAMREGRAHRLVYRRAGLPCRRCGEAIRSWPQGEAARTAYWCPGCQPGRGADRSSPPGRGKAGTRQASA